jgi:hypothetical protein
MLLERLGQVVIRDELQKRLWSTDTFVDFDRGLNKAINRVRDALEDSADSPRFIETRPVSLGDTAHPERPDAERVLRGGSHMHMRYVLLLPFAAVILVGYTAVSASQMKIPEGTYTIAFASFAPLRTNIFIANGNGENANPLLAKSDGVAYRKLLLRIRDRVNTYDVLYRGWVGQTRPEEHAVHSCRS